MRCPCQLKNVSKRDSHPLITDRYRPKFPCRNMNHDNAVVVFTCSCFQYEFLLQFYTSYLYCICVYHYKLSTLEIYYSGLVKVVHVKFGSKIMIQGHYLNCGVLKGLCFSLKALSQIVGVLKCQSFLFKVLTLHHQYKIIFQHRPFSVGYIECRGLYILQVSVVSLTDT